MADISRMKQRVVYLRRQAALYHRLAMLPRNAALHERFEDLAKRCVDIAAAIERSLKSGMYGR